MVPFGYDECSCIGVRDTFILIISTSSGDTECCVQLNQMSGEDCFDISTCLDTTTKPFFSVCNNPDPTESSPLQMCFGNITEELNGTKIYIVSSISKCGQFINRYDRGIDIQLQGNVYLILLLWT